MSDLHDAAQAGDTAAVRAILAANPYRVTNRRDDRLTPLHLAATAGHAEVAGLLLEASANPNARAYGGATPLHAAAEHGRLEIVRALLDHRASTKVLTETGETPLHAAARQGHAEVAALLLDRGADPNATGQCGGAPLHAAATAGQADVAELLLSRGALANARSTAHAEPFTPWDAARAVGHEALADLLLHHGGPDRAAGPLDAHRSAERGYDARLALLLERDPGLVLRRDVVAGRTPLHWAAVSGRGSIAELLLAHGADPKARDKRGATPADLAEASGFSVLAERLKQAAAG